MASSFEFGLSTLDQHAEWVTFDTGKVGGKHELLRHHSSVKKTFLANLPHETFLLHLGFL